MTYSSPGRARNEYSLFLAIRTNVSQQLYSDWMLWNTGPDTTYSCSALHMIPQKNIVNCNSNKTHVDWIDNLPHTFEYPREDKGLVQWSMTRKNLRLDCHSFQHPRIDPPGETERTEFSVTRAHPPIIAMIGQKVCVHFGQVGSLSMTTVLADKFQKNVHVLENLPFFLLKPLIF